MKTLLILSLVACDGEGGDANSIPIQCGDSGDCPGGEFCAFERADCGVGGPGVCKPRPTACEGFFETVCACDGQSYLNLCHANRAGLSVSANNNCPAKFFECGQSTDHACEIATEFCQHSNFGMGSGETYSCVPMPAACGATPSCACLEGQACTDDCQGDAMTGLTAICLGEG